MGDDRPAQPTHEARKVLQRDMVVVALLSSIALGCGEPSAESVAVVREPLVINTTLWTALGAKALDASGRPLATRIDIMSSDTMLLATRADAVACHDDGEAMITIRAAAVRRSLNVRCYVA